MRRHRVLLPVILATTMVVVFAVDASGNGANDPAQAVCAVPSPPGGAMPLRGAVSVVIPDAYLSVDPLVFNSNPTLNVTLRLERGPMVRVFRLQIALGQPLTNFLSNAKLACVFLDPNGAGVNIPRANVANLVQVIAASFGLGAVQRFVITDRSISRTEPAVSFGQLVCTDVHPVPDGVTGTAVCAAGSLGASAVADLVIYPSTQ